MKKLLLLCLALGCCSKIRGASVACVDVYAQVGTGTATGYVVTLVFLYSFCYSAGEPGGDPGDPLPDPDPGGIAPDPTTVANAEEFIECLSHILPYSGTEEFGVPRGTGTHEGIDLMALNGTLIYSPVNGVVRSVTDGIPRDHNITVNPAFIIGNQLVIEPPNAYIQNGTTQVANENAINQVILDHLDPGILAEFGIERGSVVTKGQPIARADNTGNTNIGPHLHLGLKKGNGEPLNPREVIPCN